MNGYSSYQCCAQPDDRYAALEMTDHATAGTCQTEPLASEIVVTRSTIERLHRHLTLAYMRNPARHIHQAVLMVEHMLATPHE